MRVQIEYSQDAEYDLTMNFIEKVIEETLLHSELKGLEEKIIEVSIALVSEQEIQRINKEYRGKNKVTDVLSFHEYSRKQDIESEMKKQFFLGELILCYDYIARAAQEDRVSLEQEMAYILSHGILHLLGFRHSPKMFAIQDRISESYASL